MAGPFFATLQEAFRESDLSLPDIWVRYFGLGGSATISQLGDFLSGREIPARIDHNIIALAINERFLELDMNHPAPYLELQT